MTSIRNLHCEDTTYTVMGKEYTGKRWSWTLDDDTMDRTKSVTIWGQTFYGEPRFVYHTNSEGDGIFCFDMKKWEDKQLAGTCDFIGCKTASGMRRKLDKYFGE